MNKCCDNCNQDSQCRKRYYKILLGNSYGAVVKDELWDTSKDYCSKWEEKENNVTLGGYLAQAYCSKENEHKTLDIKLIVEMERIVKQRIKESLEKAHKPIHLEPVSNDGCGITLSKETREAINEIYNKGFDWILKEKTNE